LVLIPILFMVQELTVRLGIFTGRGHGELIRETFGPAWAWASAAGLAVATMGALLTEFSGVAGVGELYGVPRTVTLPLAAAALLAIVMTGSYRRVERAAIAIGLFELAFFALGKLGDIGKYDDLEKQFAQLGDHSVDAELAALKRERLGAKQPPPPVLPKELGPGTKG